MLFNCLQLLSQAVLHDMHTAISRVVNSAKLAAFIIQHCGFVIYGKQAYFVVIQFLFYCQSQRILLRNPYITNSCFTTHTPVLVLLTKFFSYPQILYQTNALAYLGSSDEEKSFLTSAIGLPVKSRRFDGGRRGSRSGRLAPRTYRSQHQFLLIICN